jgi:hypothetical protein
MAHMKKLMKNKILIGGAIAVLTATSVPAADIINHDDKLQTSENIMDSSDDLYRANEVSVDVFGTGSLGKYTIEHLSNDHVRHDLRLGVGAGVNYFFTRNLGIGGDAYSENTSGAFIDDASGNLILRLPLGQSGLAPYVYGGGGGQFDRTHLTFAQAGAGLEYRFNPHIGAFLDARFVLPNETKYFGVGRAGLRFAF